MSNKIPLVDLKAQYKRIKGEIDLAIANVINDTSFIKGKFVSDFEEQYQDIYGVKYYTSHKIGYRSKKSINFLINSQFKLHFVQRLVVAINQI